MDKEQTIEELKKSFKEIQQEQEQLEYDVKNILKEEENESIEMKKSYAVLYQMEKNCSVSDKKLRCLIGEKQNMLNTLKKRKIEFKDEFLREVKKQRQKNEEELQNIKQQMIEEKENL